MPRFLIEVPHAPTQAACDQAIKVFMDTGSHFFVNADWGCEDGVHKAWFIVDIESKEAARQILPPLFRDKASIIKLRKYSMADVPDIQSGRIR